jgi:Holliday junction DNA helicase RuvA
MIAQICGKLIQKKTTEIVVDCQGVGYHLFVSVVTSEKLQDIGATVTLKTLLIHREDTMQLYGFYDDAEKEVFKLLTSISGIGPKSAIAILSSINISELKQAITNNNLLLLQKMPGIGKKTAERIMIELKDKIIKIEMETTEIDNNNVLKQEAIAALTVLGYNKVSAEKAVTKALTVTENADVQLEEIIRLALKFALQ